MSAARESPEHRIGAKLRNAAAVPGTQQRRGAQRFAVELDVSILSDDNFDSGLVQNLSETGVS